MYLYLKDVGASRSTIFFRSQYTHISAEDRMLNLYGYEDIAGEQHAVLIHVLAAGQRATRV